MYIHFPHAVTHAAELHQDQFRKYNGQPYILHPMRVAAMVAEHEIASDTTVSAAVLHDVLEDCPEQCYEGLVLGFGEEIANLVRELTNPSKGSKESRAVRKQMDRDHLATVSREAKIIKMFDRIDNISEMNRDLINGQDVEPKFARLYCTESLSLHEVLKDSCRDTAAMLTRCIYDTLENVPPDRGG